MAKSSRASVKKSNKSKLRRTVFGPVVDARTERLSQKLQELAAQPKPESEKQEMEVDTSKEVSGPGESSNHPATSSEDMDVDGAETSKASSRRSKAKHGRVHKKRHRKVQNAMTFPPVKQRRTVSRVVKRK